MIDAPGWATMFHVKHRHFIKTVLSVPGVGTATHVADLSELDATSCRLLRIVELTPNGRVAGARDQLASGGTPQAPADVVPHPDSYDAYDDITATRLSVAEFAALWQQARDLFPQLAPFDVELED